jgi:methionine-rich copper-binding protein CopC
VTFATRRLAGLVASGVLAIGLALGLAAPASAHNYLVSSTPAEGEHLTALPDEFIITTNDDLLNLGEDAGGFALQVQDADGLYYGDGCVAVAGPSMTAPAELGEPGEYLLTWQVVSIDGHTVSGEIPFSWAPDDTAEVGTGRAAPPVCGQAAEEPVASPSPSPTAEGVPEATPPASEDAGISGDLLWIGGAIAAVVVAAGVTMLMLSRKKG